MKRVYTFPYGVVPVLPTKLAPYVTLGDVEADGLVRSFSVDRWLEGETPKTEVAVVWVGVSAWFPENGVCVSLRIVLHHTIPTIFYCREGAWSVQRRCVIADRYWP